jgi:hypothetical protein
LKPECKKMSSEFSFLYHESSSSSFRGTQTPSVLTHNFHYQHVSPRFYIYYTELLHVSAIYRGYLQAVTSMVDVYSVFGNLSQITPSLYTYIRIQWWLPLYRSSIHKYVGIILKLYLNWSLKVVRNSLTLARYLHIWQAFKIHGLCSVVHHVTFMANSVKLNAVTKNISATAVDRAHSVYRDTITRWLWSPNRPTVISEGSTNKMIYLLFNYIGFSQHNNK